MNRNPSMLIVGGIVIGLIILIATLYTIQETEIIETEIIETEIIETEIIETEIIETEIIEFNFNNSDTNEISDIDKKLDEIEKKAAENYYNPPPREWITSGPFQIDRSEYLIGEKIFLTIGGLDINEKGQIAFLRTTNETHYTVFQTIPFDGTKKPTFNYYTDIRLSEQTGICSIEDVIGEWTVVFRGTDYANIKFEIIDKILPGEEDSFTKPVC